MTTRMLPKLLPTSDAPTIEKTTPKIKTKVPTQTKVCAREEEEKKMLIWLF